MQHIQESDSRSNAELSDTQELSYPKQIEIWSGRLAMLGFVATVAVLSLNAGY